MLHERAAKKRAMRKRSPEEASAICERTVLHQRAPAALNTYGRQRSKTVRKQAEMKSE